MEREMISKVANRDGSVTVTLSGGLSIEDSTGLHRQLSEALEESPQVVLDMKDVDEFDMTCMQLICSLCRSAVRIGRTVECSPDAMSGSLTAFGRRIGAPQGLPCSQNDDKPCILFGGKG